MQLAPGEEASCACVMRRRLPQRDWPESGPAEVGGSAGLSQGSLGVPPPAAITSVTPRAPTGRSGLHSALSPSP